MKHLLAFLLAACAVSAHGQTIKSLGYATNGNVVYAGTNKLTFTNAVSLRTGNYSNSVTGTTVDLADAIWDEANDEWALRGYDSEFQFNGTNRRDNFRIALALGVGNVVTFAGLTNNGDITINQTATNNGLLYIRRTNSEAFLGLANLIASNNTTISNETLFRVGTAEATNKAAQFGFRSTNTNGNGVAVFSVFGYNALMMVGADASTNAVIYSGGGTNNEVMTLIKSGATEFARPISFSTTAHAAATRTNLALGAASDPTFRDVSVRDLSIVGGSGGKIVYPATNTAPADTTNVVTWIQVNVGTNSYRVPLYQ